MEYTPNYIKKIQVFGVYDSMVLFLNLSRLLKIWELAFAQNGEGGNIKQEN